ncbi:hypothetical protein C2S53_011854 [Perilla frutescens var. hirtella]|uniref:Uncharacterized protein n=1 Tax=Perilla frutescens var. hirtella TaxID=608512 RepID=A0AAD4J5X8_PERFH|nr:hypothetical protein C2S53_011854 [Perilla frutescens var. hirtella]
MHTTSIVNQRISFPTPLPSERLGNGRGRVSPSVLAMRSDGEREKRRDYKLVDENMVVLKMRIQEMEMKERESVEIPRKKEKEHWYENYDSDVYELVVLSYLLGISM